MGLYLVQWAYAREAWGAMPVLGPSDMFYRRIVGDLGGSVLCEGQDARVGPWLAFGEYDGVAVVEFPDNQRPAPNVKAAALSMILSSGTWIKTVRTTPLLSMSEGKEAIALAAGKQYPPS